MTSKEALEILFASYNYNGNYQDIIEAREKLEQDLERLEKLEKAIELFKDKSLMKIAYSEEEKMWHFIGGHSLTNKEYELLKEVLCYGNNTNNL